MQSQQSLERLSQTELGKDPITGTWVAQTDPQGRSLFAAVARADSFRDGEDQAISAAYAYKTDRDGWTKLNKRGLGKATLFDDTDGDGVIDKGERRLGSFKADVEAINATVIAAQGYFTASGYVELDPQNGKLSIFSLKGGDLLGSGKINPSALDDYLEPVAGL